MKQPNPIETELLVVQAQQGDARAFDRLVSSWQQRLLAHIVRLTADAGVAQDLLQDTWLAAIKGLERLENPAAFPGWIYRIATNKCTDWVRRRQRERRVTTASEQESTSPPVPLPISEEVAHVAEAFAALPVEQRALLTLHYIEGFTTAEVGRILSIPAGTVKTRLYRARQTLRKSMEEQNHDTV